MRRCDARGMRIPRRTRHRRSRGPGRFLLSALVSAALVATPGCTVAGRPVPDFPDPTALDIGEYSVEPLIEPAVHDPEYGRVIESMRMAEAVVRPQEADAALRYPYGVGIVPVPTPVKASVLLADAVRDVLHRDELLAGIAVNGTSNELRIPPRTGADRFLQIMLLRFPDDGSATRAAADIDSRDAAVSRDNVGVPVPGYSAAHAHWRPGVPTVAATLAHGPFVVHVLAGHTAPDLAALTALVRGTFDQQLPRLDDFDPTPREKLAGLPLDSSGMLRLMVPQAPGRWPMPAVTLNDKDQVAGWGFLEGHGIVFGPRGGAHYLGRGSESGPESVAINGYNVLARYPDPATARERFERAVAEDAVDTTVRTTEVPTGLRDVSCRRVLGDSSWANTYCRVVHGRYQAMVFGRVAEDVRHKGLAQYGLLMGHG